MMVPMEIVGIAIVLMLAGVIIGLLSGMLGLGGGTLMIPVLRLGYGLDAFMATATSLFAIIPTSLSGAITHLRNKTCIPKLGLVLGVSGAILSPVGVNVAAISPAWLIMVVTAIIIIYSAVTMLSKAIRMKPERSARFSSSRAEAHGAEVEGPHIESQPSQPDDSATSVSFTFAMSAKNIAKGAFAGVIAGFASGYVGVGGGFIMIPMMVSWLGIPMKLASGTSLIAIIILAVPGVIQQAIFGHIDYLAGIMLCVGAIPGAIIGARLAPRVPERTLRFIFSGMLAIAAIALVVNELNA